VGGQHVGVDELDVTVEGLGTWLLTGMATRRQCRELARTSLLRELA